MSEDKTKHFCEQLMKATEEIIYSGYVSDLSVNGRSTNQ